MKTITPIISALLLIGSIISLESCDLFDKYQKPKTELEKLPPETQEGKNTFGCLVDGKAWVTRTSIDAYAYYQEGVLSIGAFIDENNTSQGIGFIIRTQELMNIIYPLNNSQEHFAEFGDNILKCLFTTTDIYFGQINLTKFDQTQLIISGTFEFEAYSSDCIKTIKITHGRFDLNYAP
jgi:hypothetical protein